MRIGIDIDDVITETSIAVKEYIEKYDKDGDMMNHIEEVMRGDMPTQNIKDFFKNESSKIFKRVKLKPNASQVIEKLINSGNEIFIITSRGDPKMKGTTECTLEYFRNNNIKYTKILFNSFEKAKICKENKIDLMIDDSEKYCREILKENIKSILFTSEINKTIPTKIERVNNWLELEEKIDTIINKDNKKI